VGDDKECLKTDSLLQQAAQPWVKGFRVHALAEEYLGRPQLEAEQTAMQDILVLPIAR
jgi:hypothetical protein